MYQADFICTYKLMDDPDDQEQLYRIQLLQAFNLEQWDDDKINTVLEELLQTLSSSEDFHIILKKSKENTNFIEVLTNAGLTISDDDIIFKMLFTYEYFDLVHWCLCDYLAGGIVKPQHLSSLLNALQN